MIKILLPILTATVVSAVPINSIYQQRCASCHGLKGEKSAMAKSIPIKGMAAEKIEKTLQEYVSGERKALPVVKMMKKNFLDASSKEQIRALTEYISTL